MQSFFNIKFLSKLLLFYKIKDVMFEDVQKERSLIKFQPIKLSYLLHGKEQYESMINYLNQFQKLGLLGQDANVYNNGRVEMIKASLKNYPAGLNHIDVFNENTFVPGILKNRFQGAGSVHIGMFIYCLKTLGSDSQVKEFMDKCLKFQVIGCYAQTQLGHGSDVQNLQTTAEYDKVADQFVLNTPNISSYKYWPGQLGLWSNYAMIFAKLITNGISHGVYPFLVQIRDDNNRPLPGVDVGDIGPKYGFATKDNGFLGLKNVRIPRKNLLRKYISVGRDGQIKRKGNPKISYATMMIVRKYLSTIYTKVYGQGIIIATRYSIMRKQFKDENQQQIKILDYQLQQNKITSCIAEYYAITLAGNKLNKLTQLNFKMVTQQNDDSLMAQTHNCLCLAKAFFTDTTLKGLQVCRLALGGHGFAHYSGLPGIIEQYSPNVTMEGQNSILYLQLARYIMKSYNKTLTKKKQIGPSVKYIQSLQYLLQKKCSISVDGADHWNIQHIRVLLAQSVCYLITTVAAKFMENQGGSQKATWDKHSGIRLYQLAQMHAIYYAYTGFEEAVIKFQDETIKQILFDLCLLFGINSILNNPQALIESQLIESHHLKSLQVTKEKILKKLRPNLIGLADGIGIPDSGLRSSLISGNIYKNLFDLAKKSEMNTYINPGVWILKSGLKNTTPKL